MKVVIGKYVSWWTTSRFDSWATKKIYGCWDWELTDEQQSTRGYKAYEWVLAVWQVTILMAINKTWGSRPRVEYIKIDNHDLWNGDDTLARIILPFLIRMRADKTGTPNVYIEDVPDHLLINAHKSTVDSMGGTDTGVLTGVYDEATWDYILDQCIWSFEQIVDPTEKIEMKVYEDYVAGNITKEEWLRLSNEYSERVQRGLMLFGKYLRSMWT
jgi:hypothetical protein